MEGRISISYLLLLGGGRMRLDDREAKLFGRSCFDEMKAGGRDP